MDRIRFRRCSTPVLGVVSDDRVTVLEVIINGEPLDWLWLQATGHEIDGSRLERNPADWMAVLDSEVSGDRYSRMRPGAEPRRIPVLQLLAHGRRVGTATVSASATADAVSWSDFQADVGQPVALGPFLFDATQYHDGLDI